MFIAKTSVMSGNYEAERIKSCSLREQSADCGMINAFVFCMRVGIDAYMTLKCRLIFAYIVPEPCKIAPTRSELLAELFCKLSSIEEVLVQSMPVLRRFICKTMSIMHGYILSRDPEAI